MLENKKYGRLTPIKFEYKKGYVKFWPFKCNCGKIILAREGNVKNGHTSSCGCYRKEIMKTQEYIKKSKNFHGENNPNYKHGFSRESIYHTWSSMKQRCFNPKATEYSAYGGR